MKSAKRPPVHPANLLFIFSDQHNRDILGCYGNPAVATPNLDRLAGRGVRFDRAYTASPLCCPARAALATGLPVHRIGCWDNAFPYDGSLPGWAHRLRDSGVRVDAVGKLHYRSAEDDNGFTREHDTLHVVDGEGDVLGCLREDTTLFDKRAGVLAAGPGTSSYTRYDAENADFACGWIRKHARDTEPWMLYLGIALPHPPNLAPRPYFDLYRGRELPMPPQWRQEDQPDHPAVDFLRRFFNFQEPIPEDAVQRFLAAYYGACSYVDHQVGKVLSTLQETGLEASTRVVYSSDHGEALGARGVFGKFSLYEEAVAVPLIMAGPDVPAGRAVRDPVSLMDCSPTFLECFGLEEPKADAALGDRPGRSLWRLLEEPSEEPGAACSTATGVADRSVFAEYHGPGTRRGAYMLADRRYKYIHHVGAPSRLFDLQEDPGELRDLSDDPGVREVLVDMERRLRRIVEPEAADARARRDQAARVAATGGADAVRRRGTFDNSPVPGEAPVYFTREAGQDEQQEEQTR